MISTDKYFVKNIYSETQHEIFFSQKFKNNLEEQASRESFDNCFHR